MIKTILAFVIGTCLAVLGFWYSDEISQSIPWGRLPGNWKEEQTMVSPLGELADMVRGPSPLDEMSFEALAERTFEPGEITLKEVLDVEDEYISYVMSYEVDGRTVTGMANIPVREDSDEKLPVIVLLRGYVDPNLYITGIGTRNAAFKFAKEGYITLAPDFLGFGGSDDPEADVWWERFHKPVEILQLMANIETMEEADPNRVGIWGHSNGGQLALSVLEITQKAYPTTLWAPVTKSFPYSVLYFTDEYDDEGKDLRRLLAKLEERYDVEKYSIGSYWERIEAPIQLHQGGEDDAVPAEWSGEFTIRMRSFDKDVQYYYYPNADHNLDPNWDLVVARDIAWFETLVKNPIEDAIED